MRLKDSLLLGFPENSELARVVAERAAIAYADIQLHSFPDGESKVTLPPDLPSHVILYRSLDHPNEKLVELLLAAGGCRAQGVKKLTLVAPYLSYMRQDKAFNPGEVVSQQIIGQLLAERFDGVLTVDSHLHRIQHLSQAIPVAKAVNITATEPMACFLESHFDKPFLLGPDAESLQWVEQIARYHQTDFAVAGKERLGDKEVIISLPAADFQGRDVVIVDDVASSGQTLIQAARQLTEPDKQQPASVSVLVTHALFMQGAMQQLYDAGVANIWSSDSINHESNAVSLADLLAVNLQQFSGLMGHENGSPHVGHDFPCHTP